MKIAFLRQEFEVESTRTVKEEFMSAFKDEMEVAERLEKVQKAIEKCVSDLELMERLLDEFDFLQRRAQVVDLDVVDVKINKMIPELGFALEDADRLVASFNGGWQMRMSLDKTLLQDQICYYWMNRLIILTLIRLGLRVTLISKKFLWSLYLMTELFLTSCVQKLWRLIWVYLRHMKEITQIILFQGLNGLKHRLLHGKSNTRRDLSSSTSRSLIFLACTCVFSSLLYLWYSHFQL